MRDGAVDLSSDCVAPKVLRRTCKLQHLSSPVGFRKMVEMKPNQRRSPFFSGLQVVIPSGRADLPNFQGIHSVCVVPFFLVGDEKHKLHAVRPDRTIL